MAWIESHQELGSHPKVIKLSRILGIPKTQVVGHLHYFWWWALDYAQGGALGRFDALDIAIGGEWDGDSDVFLDALIRAGFIDQTDAGLVIHDWDLYGGKLQDKRTKDAERKRAARDALRMSDGRPSDVPTTARVEKRRVEKSREEKNGSADAPAPTSIEDLPRNGPAQTLVAEWYRRVGSVPANYRKAVGQAQALVQAGVDVPELMLIYDHLAAEPFWASGFDLGIALSQLDKIRQSRQKRQPKPAPIP